MSNYPHQGRYASDYDSKRVPATLNLPRKHNRASQDSNQVVDPASKRLFFLSLFVLLESWKIYDAIALKSSKIGVNITSLNKFTFVVKYFLLEGIFFWTLPLFNVSQLSFNPVTTFIITAVLNVLTFFLVSDSTIPIVGSLIFPAIDIIRQRSELTLAGDLVRSGTAIDIDSYFKGRYTIHYVPDSTAYFNPFEKKDFCLIDGSAIGVPVQFNTTNQLGWLQLQHISPEKEVNLYNYTQNDIAKLLKRDYSHLIQNPGFVSNDERIFHLELPLKEPGQYSIKEVRDVDGLKIRTYKSELTISSCPSARVVSSVDDSQYICVPEPNRSKLESLTLPQVEVYGVFPMELEFAVSLGKSTITLKKITINNSTENGQIHLRLSRSVKRVFLESLVDDINIPEVASGLLEFRILLVRDALNVNRKYNPHSDARDLLGRIDLKTKPSIRLSERNQGSKLLVNGTKTLAINIDRSLVQDGDWPITVMIEYQSPSRLSSYNFSRVFHGMHEASKGFEVAKAGSYRLVSASSKFCDCKLDGRTVVIDQAEPPQIDITSEPIIDKCVGMTGYNFKFDAKGQPPFQVQYQVFQNKSNGVLKPVHDAYGNVYRTLRFQDETHDFDYKPPGEGNYIVVFKTLRDGYYQREGVPLDEKVHTYLTYFRQRSRLSIDAADDSDALPICLGSQVDVPISMSGNFPFLMSYRVIDTSSGKVIESNTVKDLNDSRFIIQTPKFDKGGSYRVQIDKLTDSLGCEANLVGQNYRTVNVRRDIPEVSLGIEADSWSVSIVEGDSLKLPLKVQSSVGNTHRDRLVYSITDLNNSSDTKIRTAIGIENLRIKEAGRYKLLSYSSGGCEGRVASPQRVITVDYIPRPSIALGAIDRGDLKGDNDFEGRLGPVCRGGTKKVEMFLNGKRPFIVNYQIKDPSGRVESRIMTVNNDRVTITLPTENHGIYRHKFLSVYDSLYTQEKTVRLNVPPLTSQLQYEVHPLPQLAIKSGSEYLQFCESTLKKISKLPPKIQLNLKGQFPIALDVTLQRGDDNVQEKFQVKHLTASEVDLNDIISSVNGQALDQTLKVGDYFLLFDKITDNNGCSNQIQDANVVVLVTEVPKMKREPNSKYYCVGDHITYDLVGISPFTVFYNFNGNSRKAQLDSKFSRLASKPGNLTITALLDSSIDHCLVNFTNTASLFNSLQAEIHDLPSVEVNQGEYIVRNIHEGDKTEIKFSFTGVPPFSLTYVRMLEENPKHKKQQKHRVVEKETIDNIWDHEYVLLASLEGTYEAIEVRDAYCKALKVDYIA